MDARLRDLQARGAGGSGAEIAAMLGSTQQTSENRMLQDMLALAQAQERAERATTARAALAGEMRGQSFGEAFDTGAAADAMSLANREYGYDALSDAGELATDMRGQGFDESFSTGQSSDLMAQYNRDNSIDVQEYNAELQRMQNQDNWARAADIAGASFGATDSAYSRDADVYDAERDVTGDQYARAQDYYGATSDANAAYFDRSAGMYDATTAANQAEWQRGADLAQQGYDVSQQAYEREAQLAGTGYALTDQNYGRGMELLGEQEQADQNWYDRNMDQVENTWGATELYTGNQRSDQTNVNQTANTYAGQLSAEEAARLAGRGTTGLFSDEGLFGLEGIPIF